MIRWVVYLLRIFKMFHGLMNNPVFRANGRDSNQYMVVSDTRKWTVSLSTNLKLLKDLMKHLIATKLTLVNKIFFPVQQLTVSNAALLIVDRHASIFGRATLCEWSARVAEVVTYKTHKKTQKANNHTFNWTRTSDPRNRMAAKLGLPLGSATNFIQG